MLRTIRLTAAIVCFTLITLLFLDFTGTLHTWFGWLAKIQFLPALLALNIGVVLFLVVLYIPVRTYLLLCYLSVGSVSGHCFVGIRQTKEKSVPLFTSNEMVAVWRFRSIHYHDGCRIELFGYLAGTV